MNNPAPDPPIISQRGIGPQRARLLARLGISTVRDALYHLPFRYEDRARKEAIASLSVGDARTVRGRIVSARNIRTRRRHSSILDLVINDGTGLIRATWFNQPYLQRMLGVGQEVVLHGTVKRSPPGLGGLAMESPEYEVILQDGDACVHTNRIVPVYRITEGISQKQYRKIMFDLVRDHAGAAADPLPAELREKTGLPSLAECLRQIHFPDSPDELEALNSRKSVFHQRLAFDELFLMSLGLALLKQRTGRERGIAFRCDGAMGRRLETALPFSLTAAQQRVLAEIREDMRAPHPMHRLVHGDVGSGKTFIALFAMLEAVECGYQAALMAPTEILAEQHYLTISRLADGIGIRTALVTGSSRDRDTSSTALGKADLVIGTHSLIQEGVSFRRLGFVVIDEQHKFGVLQRSILRKKGLHPDLLVMTATPIPRSLALTIYGDLDVSLLDSLPPGRSSIETRLCDAAQKAEIYSLLRREIGEGRQAYVVYPSIEESEKVDLKSAIQGREAFQRIFPDLSVGLLHGRMPAEEREAVIRAFRDREIDILVSTTVIEVGVDVPNATVMLIVHAERFGLAQLHQLRGRVGRGQHPSTCVLIGYPPYGDVASRRLRAMEETGNGFRIAEQDLAIRGPGEFLGVRQAGMPDFSVADIVRDLPLLEMARREAYMLLAESPDLKEFPSLRQSLEVFWKGKVDFLMTG